MKVNDGAAFTLAQITPRAQLARGMATGTQHAVAAMSPRIVESKLLDNKYQFNIAIKNRDTASIHPQGARHETPAAIPRQPGRNVVAPGVAAVTPCRAASHGAPLADFLQAGLAKAPCLV
ncbi:hypothetical protein [Vogesella urethralis]|uniref:hypothetical protein n=1 Tax=Vogesella urethralis TaxID=2592656 RepID=UPI001186276C|nr:hypothetical protein [Vogesella urethralis]